VYILTLQILAGAVTYIVDLLRGLFAACSIRRGQEVVEEIELSCVRSQECNNNHDIQGDNETNMNGGGRGNDK